MDLSKILKGLISNRAISSKIFIITNLDLLDGNLTIKMINSDHDKPAKLAIEVWSTFAEVEMSRNAQGIPH